jgi:adenylate cyclase
MSDGPLRRLAAIVAIDVVGYSRLMGADEPGTLVRLKEHRAATDPIGEKHGGRIVGTAGDGLLLEFPSVVEAVGSAIEVQILMAERNANLPDDKKMLYRIGVHLGDVMIDGDDIFGDGVNIAARIEPLADPGGVSVSDDAYRQVRDRLEISWEDGGEHEAKNIVRPIQIWRWRANQISASVDPASKNEPPPLPDKPSIAILPFDNMSGDPDQEYFADGLTEELITAVSRSEDLFVIARNSSFVFRGGNIDVKEVGKKLGARYVLEGSIRKAGIRVRITAQLIEAESCRHVWADKFDGSLEDIFELQDEIASRIIGQLLPKLEHAETERARRVSTDNVGAYDLYLRAIHHFYAFSQEDIVAALKNLEEALEIEPNFARALALSGVCRVRVITNNWHASVEQEHLDAGVAEGQRAAKLAPDDATVLWMSGLAIGRLSEDIQRGIDLIDQAIQLNPNSYQSYGFGGLLKTHIGDNDRAINYLKNSIRLNPTDPRAFNFRSSLADAFVQVKMYDEAKRHAMQALQLNPRFELALRVYIASCIGLGEIEEGLEGARRLVSIYPKFTLADLQDSWKRQLRPIHQGKIEHIDALRKAGLPEE